MIKLSKGAALLQAALIAVAVFGLCSRGQAQSPPTPSVAITYPAPGGTFNTAYIQVLAHATGFSSVTSATLVVYNNAGVSTSYPMEGSSPDFNQTWNTSSIIPTGQTSYNATVGFQVVVTGYNQAYPPVLTSAKSLGQLNETVQVGYILGASSGNTATVTAPTNGATVHLTGTPFTISSDHHVDFFRYDAFGAYSPTYGIQLQTTFPSASGYNVIESQNPKFQLPLQPGDVYMVYSLTHAETYGGTLTNGMMLPFLNQALSFYPIGSEIASNVTSATAVYP